MGKVFGVDSVNVLCCWGGDYIYAPVFDKGVEGGFINFAPLLWLRDDDNGRIGVIHLRNGAFVG